MDDLDDPKTLVAAGPASLPAPVVDGTGQLIVVDTPIPLEVGRTFRLDATSHVIGRAENAHFRILDDGLSRIHARIQRTADGAWELQDADSTNGTCLNGVRVTRAMLREDDRIQIGLKTILRFSTRDRGSQGGLHQVLSAARTSLWDLSLDSQLITWSDRVDQTLRLAPGSLSNHRGGLLALVHPEDQESVRTAIELSREKGDHLEVEFRLQAPTAVDRWVSCKGDLVRNEAGAPIRIIGTMTDITARKTNELELRRQALMFTSIYDGGVILDLKGCIVDWNASAERMFGYAKPEVLGKALFDLLRPDHTPPITDAIFAAIEKDGRWAAEVELATRAREPVHCESVVAPLKDARGATIGHLAVNRDISERKRLQARLLLNERLASIGVLAAGVAHEINNPLAFISANLSFVTEELERLGLDPGAEVKEVLAETQHGATRIANIVRDLKSFARDGREDEPGPVDVQKTLDVACSMANNVIRHRALLVKHFQPGPVVVAGVESRLCQVFLNLLINAAHSIPEGCSAQNEITISVRPQGDAAVAIEISDTGCGMPPEVQARIFDPFFTTKPQGVGTGLGLSICHGIIEGLSGKIGVKSAPGVGSTFEVVLPAATAVAQPAPSSPLPSRAGGRSAHVLVIDDEPTVARSLGRALAGAHEVATAQGATEGLGLLAAGHRYDLILCDLMMPERSGMDFYAELLARFPEHARKVVFMTGGVFSKQINDFLDEVPNRKLNKPLDLGKLRALVARSVNPAS